MTPSSSPFYIYEYDGSCIGLGGGSQVFGDACGSQTLWTQDGNGELHSTSNGQCLNDSFMYSDVCSCGIGFAHWDTCDGNNAQEKFSFTVTGNNPYPHHSGTIAPYWPAQPNLVLDLNGNNRANGTHIDVTAYNGTSAQFWVYNASTKAITLIDDNTWCVDKPNGQNGNGTLLQVWQCNGQPQQQWNYENGQFINVQSGTCLDSPNGDVSDSPDVWVYGCWGGLNQQWATQTIE